MERHSQHLLKPLLTNLRQVTVMTRRRSFGLGRDGSKVVVGRLRSLTRRLTMVHLERNLVFRDVGTLFLSYRRAAKAP